MCLFVIDCIFAAHHCSSGCAAEVETELQHFMGSWFADASWFQVRKREADSEMRVLLQALC